MMNGGRLSNGKDSWNDANAAPLGTNREMIDLTIVESQRRSFGRFVDGRIHDGLSCEVVIESVNGVGETSLRVRVAPS